MKEEVRKDLYTQSEYARKIGVTRSTITYMIKTNKLKTLVINGSTLIKENK